MKVFSSYIIIYDGDLPESKFFVHYNFNDAYMYVSLCHWALGIRIRHDIYRVLNGISITSSETSSPSKALGGLCY